jgi:hypothetical protein
MDGFRILCFQVDENEIKEETKNSYMRNTNLTSGKQLSKHPLIVTFPYYLSIIGVYCITQEKTLDPTMKVIDLHMQLQVCYDVRFPYVYVHKIFQAIHA